MRLEILPFLILAAGFLGCEENTTRKPAGGSEPTQVQPADNGLEAVRHESASSVWIFHSGGGSNSRFFKYIAADAASVSERIEAPCEVMQVLPTEVDNKAWVLCSNDAYTRELHLVDATLRRHVPAERWLKDPAELRGVSRDGRVLTFSHKDGTYLCRASLKSTEDATCTLSPRRLLPLGNVGQPGAPLAVPGVEACADKGWLHELVPEAPGQNARQAGTPVFAWEKEGGAVKLDDTPWSLDGKIQWAATSPLCDRALVITSARDDKREIWRAFRLDRATHGIELLVQPARRIARLVRAEKGAWIEQDDRAVLWAPWTGAVSAWSPAWDPGAGAVNEEVFTERDDLLQVFARRVLRYTPGESPGRQVVWEHATLDDGHFAWAEASCEGGPGCCSVSSLGVRSCAIPAGVEPVLAESSPGAPELRVLKTKDGLVGLHDVLKGGPPLLTIPKDTPPDAELKVLNRSAVLIRRLHSENGNQFHRLSVIAVAAKTERPSPRWPYYLVAGILAAVVVATAAVLFRRWLREWPPVQPPLPVNPPPSPPPGGEVTNTNGEDADPPDTPSPPPGGTDGSKMNAAEKALLRGAMTASFTMGELDLLVTDHLEADLESTGKGEDKPTTVDKVIKWADRRGRLSRLVRGVLLERPDKPEVIALARGLGLHPSADPAPALEAIVGPNKAFHDANQFLYKGYLAGTRVCQVLKNGEPVGTGVLVGPDAILTNWHVMKDARKTPDGASEYEFLFGFAVTERGDRIDEGEPFRAARDWHIASSPIGDPVNPTKGELDFALVRLSEAAGRLSVGRTTGGQPRGCVPLSDRKPNLQLPGIAILGHPAIPGQVKHPLKLSFDATDRAGESPSGARVTYAVPTYNGSSGSPVFRLSSWELIALHHAGFHGIRNQAIPAWLIAEQPDVKAYLNAIQAG